MHRGSLPTTDRLARIQSLLKGLPGPLGNGELAAWANPGNADSMPSDVLALIDGAGLIERPGTDQAASVPRNSCELMTRLLEVDEDQATNILVKLMSQTLAYHAPGRYEEGKAREIATALTRLLGHGTRWWTNTDAHLSGWRSLTRHILDGAVIAAGNGVIVTVIAFDED